MSQEIELLHKEILQLINGLMPITSSAFYFVDKHMSARGIALNGVSASTDREYRDRFLELDLAAPRRFEKSDEKLVILEKLFHNTNWRSSVYYKEFLQPLNIEHVADMFFRDNSKNIVAVLTILRDDSFPPFTKEEINTMNALHRFIEFSIKTLYLPKRDSCRDSIRSEFCITSREMDVLESIMKGLDNKNIAMSLGVSLATVKTHINHIFQKTQVASRNELLVKFSYILG
ncbi:putative Monoamine regulon transcriptional regulator [Vibrio coralliirubri]|uniref:response regulator transcription factor n=1 Tax=Vibrio coralliirubri TaxID=1516159 RepID=UPI00063588A4|nr:helix-turn-helix transcriptional regulator [Vibrio coralliirubri]CDT53896.1 putative Monoamine regulon transcriptional regulator [Vibrio coralliirubri]